MKDHESAEHHAEAKARWGHTDAYRQSTERTASYSDEDWTTIRAELEAIEKGFAEAMEGGSPADSEEALALAERARLHIDRWHYGCSPEMHARLADMYTADERFRAHYDDRSPGLADYVSSAIKANAARLRPRRTDPGS